MNAAGSPQPLDASPGFEQTFRARMIRGTTYLVVIFCLVKAGKLELCASPTDVGVLLGELGENLGSLVRKGGKRWEVDVPSDLGFQLVDGPRLGQIVTNLVGNAAKFTRDSRVALSAVRVDGQLRIDVLDTGIGIPREQQASASRSPGSSPGGWAATWRWRARRGSGHGSR